MQSDFAYPCLVTSVDFSEHGYILSLYSYKHEHPLFAPGVVAFLVIIIIIIIISIKVWTSPEPFLYKRDLSFQRKFGRPVNLFPLGVQPIKWLGMASGTILLTS
jgi:hypothetical protein